MATLHHIGASFNKVQSLENVLLCKSSLTVTHSSGCLQLCFLGADLILDKCQGRHEKFVSAPWPSKTYVHMCVIVHADGSAACRQDTDASIMEGEYEWVREYLYDVRQDEEKRTYVLRETPEYMGYVDLNTRLMVHKRGKRLKSEQLQPQEFPRPAKVCLLSLSLQSRACSGIMWPWPLQEHVPCVTPALVLELSTDA